ncbi:hypothetical protein C8J56DRAFT_1137386 [Mycena floridula]|nr:hypothetical protein C8J56DRAFT_1137386 [Mycena floridula]
MDATRIKDGTPVMLKRVSKVDHANAIRLGLFFSSPHLSARPKNHCAIIHEVLQVPGEANSDILIVVMSLLRVYDSPRLETIADVIELIRQSFEGLRFMHKNYVAHGNLTLQNIMMDASVLYPEGYHPVDIDRAMDFMGPAKPLVRLDHPPKYYIIDFNNLLRPDEAAKIAFSEDIYTLACSIHETFLQAKPPYSSHLLRFMAPLLTHMMVRHYTRRPTIDDVVQDFDQIWRSLSTWTLRSLVIVEKRNSFLGRLGFGNNRPKTHNRAASAIESPVTPTPAPFASFNYVRGRKSSDVAQRPTESREDAGSRRRAHSVDNIRPNHQAESSGSSRPPSREGRRPKPDRSAMSPLDAIMTGVIIPQPISQGPSPLSRQGYYDPYTESKMWYSSNAFQQPVGQLGYSQSTAAYSQSTPKKENRTRPRSRHRET